MDQVHNWTNSKLNFLEKRSDWFYPNQSYQLGKPYPKYAYWPYRGRGWGWCGRRRWRRWPECKPVQSLFEPEICYFRHFLSWTLEIHLNEKSTEEAALLRVVSGEEEKGVAKNGKGTKESWSRNWLLHLQILNTTALIPNTHPQIPFLLVPWNGVKMTLSGGCMDGV